MKHTIHLLNTLVDLQSSQHPRRGAMLIMIAAMLTVLFAMAAFCVDVAYMSLVRTELKVSCDAAVKAATRELSLKDGDTSKAITAGINIAALNKVGGATLKLQASDFEFGQAVRQNDGKWKYNVAGPPYTAVRLVADKGTNSLSGDVKLFFAPLVGSESFTPRVESISAYPESEVVLCIDRSHSMCFNESGVDWAYPSGVPSVDYSNNGRLDSDDAFLTPPGPTGSRWTGLAAAVNQFLDTLAVSVKPPNVGLVTWSSDLGTNTYEYQLTGETVKASVKDVAIGNDYTSIRTAIASRGNQKMMGGTNTAAGLDDAINMLEEKNPTSKKTIVLMTDGMENAGRGSINSANDAAAAGIVIHVVTFLNGDQSSMQAVANATGGRHIHAANSTELKDAFDELAKQLPVVLID